MYVLPAEIKQSANTSLETCKYKSENLQIKIGNLQIQIGKSANPNRESAKSKSENLQIQIGKSANPNWEICRSKLQNLPVRIYGRVHLDLASCVGIWANWPHWTHLVTLGPFWVLLSHLEQPSPFGFIWAHFG